jgi:hypothetical protein
MNRAFVITAVLLLSPFPAFGSLSRCWTGPDRCSRQAPRRAALPGRSLRPADGLDIVAGVCERLGRCSLGFPSRIALF